eukprot:1175650-Prorocentrum_minimum.AAC.2
MLRGSDRVEWGKAGSDRVWRGLEGCGGGRTGYDGKSDRSGCALGSAAAPSSPLALGAGAECPRVCLGLAYFSACRPPRLAASGFAGGR